MYCGNETSWSGIRGFLTKEEKIEILDGYKKELELEAKAVQEHIEQLKKNN